MITFESRSVLARDVAAQFATELLITRCRVGAEQALMPQGRWFAANTQGLHDWLREGGFQSEIQPKQRKSRKTSRQPLEEQITADINENSGTKPLFSSPEQGPVRN